MPSAFTNQTSSGTLKPTKPDGSAGEIDGVPMWSSSDPAILSVTPAADGMSFTCETHDVLGVAHLEVDMDVDLGDGVKSVKESSPDVLVEQNPKDQVSGATIAFTPFVDKV